MINTIVNISSLVVIVLMVLWIVWYLVNRFWPLGAESTAGQILGKVADTTQAYTMYGVLEAMKIDNMVKEDANALGAIAYLQSVVMRGVAKDWTAEKEHPNENSISQVPDDVHADEINWNP